jgi:hypothetical protein
VSGALINNSKLRKMFIDSFQFSKKQRRKEEEKSKSISG